MSTEARAPLSLLDEVLCTALAIGAVLVTLLPAARGMSAFGWLPMWLVGMPAVAWWGLHGFALPRRAAELEPVSISSTSRRTRPQARRRARPARRTEARRAA
ncbi:hypothetical protein [Lysobacter claricitrinus]|uniref:hypothetical protein n=1 Tax=Lysobacter claricitrinus TaxID=3367728 RepID=UPI0037DB2AEE